MEKSVAKGPYYIAIEGVIGSGKTSLATLMAEKLDAQLILEKPEENPYLEDFYKHPRRFSFQVQLFFLLSRYRQLADFPQHDLFHQYLIADYIFQKDKIFARVNLEQRDLILYDRVASLLERNLPKPDFVIYLQSTTANHIANIKKRKRPYEKNISPDYIKALNEAYKDFFFQYKDTPLLVINTSEIDFVNNEEDLEDLLKQILHPPVGVKYYVPRTS